MISFKSQRQKMTSFSNRQIWRGTCVFWTESDQSRPISRTRRQEPKLGRCCRESILFLFLLQNLDFFFKLWQEKDTTYSPTFIAYFWSQLFVKMGMFIRYIVAYGWTERRRIANRSLGRLTQHVDNFEYARTSKTLRWSLECPYPTP